jgi:hypothetical protein
MDARRSLGTTAVVLTLALSVPLQACADASKASSSGKLHNPQAPMKTAPMKANGSGISVQYRLDATPQAGLATPVVLSFDGVTDAAGATVRWTADGGLSLANAAETRTLPAGQATTLTVQVVPGAAGIGYLHVFTTQHGASSVTSIPVQVGKAPSAMPASSDLKQTPGGDKILSMPVK